MATGMFDSLNALNREQRQEDVDDQQRLRFMAQSPVQARALASYDMADLAGKGLGQVASAAAGVDPRTYRERDVDALRAAKEAVGAMEDVDLNTPAGVDSYYKGVIDILRKHNLPAEAHAAAKEWNEYKGKNADRQLKEDELKRKVAADQVKANDLLAKQQAANERNAQLAQRGMGEFVGWIDRIEKTDDPQTKALLLQRANAEIESKKKGVILENAGDRIIVRDKATGAVIGKADEVGEKPLSAKDRMKNEAKDADTLSAYRADMQGLQTVYKAAADFYNSAGLDDLIGKWTGIAAEQGPEKGGAFRELFISRLGASGQEALGLYQQVQGASFIKALKDLKAAGKGSTGLGAVSEVEGNKIQAANAALFPRQQPASFRRKLSDFIETIEAAANNLAVKAQEEGIEPIHLNTIPLSGPSRRGAAPASAPNTPQQPAQPGGEPTVKMMKDGKTRQVFRSKVEEAKRRGYTEVK
jgi:hypothetical protein